MRAILFVCTGNVCRSPMAEHMLRRRLGVDSDWNVCSAGLAAGYGMTASTPAIEVLAESGIDMSEHRSRPVDREMVDAASMIVVMSASHYDQMRLLFPYVKGKVFLLKSFDPSARCGDLEDPIGASIGTYRRIRDEIAAALPDLMEFMDRLES